MHIIVAGILILVAVGLFLLWRKRVISNDLLNAVAAILSAVAGLAAIAVFIVPAAQPSTQIPPNEQTIPVVLTAIAQATAVSVEPATGQISKCEWLLKNFPQTQEGVEAFFGNENYEMQLLYHQCASGPVVQGVVLSPRDGKEHGIWVTAGACADGVPDPEYDSWSFRGNRRQLDSVTYRVFERILLSAKPITYWAWCDEIH